MLLRIPGGMSTIGGYVAARRRPGRATTGRACPPHLHRHRSPRRSGSRVGAGSVTAIDISRRNARVHGHTIRVSQGSLTVPVRGECFDLVISNPRTCPLRKTESPAPAWRAPGMPAPTGACSSTDFAPRHPTSLHLGESRLSPSRC